MGQNLHAGASIGASASAAGSHSSISVDAAVDHLETSWTHEASPSPIKWAGSNITYSVLDHSVAGIEGNGFSVLSATKAAVVSQAFELWDDLINVNITQVANGGITVGESSTTSGGGTYTSYEFRYDGIQHGVDAFTSADIWFNKNWSALNEDTDFDYGSYGRLTYLHEIGHSLGLSHPGTYDAGAGGVITYGNSAEFAEDTRQYTIMSYFDAGANGNGASYVGADGQVVYAQTPMLYDIAAIQDLYGADHTTRSGDTTYGFGASGMTGHEQVYDFSVNAEPVLTIWDGGGTDLLNVSGFANNSVIDLREGAWSSVAGMNQNVAIAYGTVIENAAGGAASEVIYGNFADNTLAGNDGADTLHGFGGDDIIFGGRDASSDQLFGDAGNDQLYGGAGDDMLYGGTGNDFLGGGVGSDAMWGEDGNDTMFGGGVPGDDHMDAGAGDDVVWAGAGNDVIYGQEGNDLLGAAGGNDIIDGGTGNDTVYGGAGNDQIAAGAGADKVYGGTGNDFVDLGGADQAADTFFFGSGQGADTVTGFEVGTDTLDFGDLAASVEAIKAVAQDVAEGLLFNFGGESLLVENVHIGDLDNLSLVA